MEQREREQRERNQMLEQRLQDSVHLDRDGQAAAYRDMSPEQQAATARALKPHSRSVVDLDKLRFEPPIGQPIEKQPKRSRKWQFGIRSRNQPYEAMLYLYRAIAAQGGLWDIQPVESGKSFIFFI
jgi:carbon catabolite-derepressing protein kinase